MKQFTINDWRRFFPFPEPRKEQEQLINFILDAFLNQGKKYTLCDAGVGIGKSAVGVTVSNYINEYAPIQTGFTPGAYLLTTQKILQEQYLNDFGPGKGKLLSIKSSSNYQCLHAQSQSCAESRRVLAKMGKQLAGTDFANTCRNHCPYACDKKAFIDSPLSITNYSYFLAETMYAGKLEPRELIVCDEAHNLENEFSKFIEVTFSERFARDILKVKVPPLRDQKEVVDWVKTTYKRALTKHLDGVENAIQSSFVSGMSSFGDLSKQYEMLDKHLCKVNRFINTYDPNNWVLNVVRPMDAKKGARGLRKFEFKPIDVSPYGNDLLFKFGERVLMMSATIVDKDIMCTTLGIPDSETAYISVESPFPIENHPIHYLSVGKMSNDEIQQTLPKMIEVLKDILESHANDKGILHCVNFKVVNYIRDHIVDPRLLVQNDQNRDEILRKHLSSTQPTVLVSPSMMEGVDLKDDLSRFQIFCKLPYPHMGDEVVKKRMKRNPEWYPFVTARSIIQASGRSIRNENDHAVTYVLDGCFETFYRTNRKYFPQSFQKSLVK